MYATVLSILLAAPVAGATAESERLARGAYLGWAALVCSGFSEMAKKPEKESERLQLLGIKKLREFLVGWDEKRVSEADIVAQVPWIITLVGRGPNIEFALGRIFETAMRDSVETVTEPVGAEPILDAELKQMRAIRLYEEKNCGLLGR